MVRKEIDFLRESGLLHCDAAGMAVSPSGQTGIEELKGIIREFHGLTKDGARAGRAPRSQPRLTSCPETPTSTRR